MGTAEVSKYSNNVTDNLNISQLLKEGRNVDVLYQQWKKGVDPETSGVLLKRINALVHECRYVLNRGTVPTNPKKKLAERTVKMLETHMSKWSEISIDVKKNTPLTAGLLLYLYERATYKEVLHSDPATPIETVQKVSVQTHENIKLGKRGVSRDFYTEINST
jgi:hypothetical protein